MRPTESHQPDIVRDDRVSWVPVEVVTTIDPQTFRTAYVERNRPLLVQGAVADWPAITRWTDPYLRRTIGHGRFGIETSADQFEGRIFEDVQEVTMTFGEFLDRMHTPQGASDYFVGHWLRPELRPDVLEHPVFGVMGGPLYRRRMIMSRGGNRIALHQDWYENLIAQVAGWKRVVLCDPLDTAYLRPHNNHKSNYSALDIRALDLGAYPDVGRVRFYEATIHPGDLLYVPTKWWHTVESFERNIMISSAFVEQDRVLVQLLERWLQTGRHELGDEHVQAVRAILAEQRRPIVALARYAAQTGLVELMRFVYHRRIR